MNKRAIWIVIAILVVAALVYFMSSKKSSPTAEQGTGVQSSQQSANSTSQATPPTATPQSLKDLLSAGTAVKCTFSDAGNQGTFYVNSGKARGDFTAAGKMGHMIMMDKTSYVWMDGASQGFKASMDTTASNTPTTPATPSQGVDASKKMNYSCSPWSGDASQFTLPGSVNFLDTAAMMKVPNIPVPTK